MAVSGRVSALNHLQHGIPASSEDLHAVQETECRYIAVVTKLTQRFELFAGPFQRLIFTKASGNLSRCATVLCLIKAELGIVCLLKIIFSKQIYSLLECWNRYLPFK